MIYLDSCAIVKLVCTESHSEALNLYVSNVRALPISSQIARLEVLRTLRGNEQPPEVLAMARHLLDRIARLPIIDSLDGAINLPHQYLRSLDALHLATALGLGRALTQFVTYDRQLGKAAEEAGLPVLAPGA